MAKTLDPKFTLTEADPSDIDEIFRLTEEAFADDEIWNATFKHCTKDDIHQWTMSVLAPRWIFPDITIYNITEVASGRIVAWTGLQFPWADRPLNDEQLAAVNSHDLPPAIKGINMEALETFLECLTFASDHGYNPVQEYHRKGTMVHPDFQKRGLRSVLTYHCNAVADKNGGKTWVPARPSSVKIFRQCEFKDIATHNAQLERFGGNPEKNTTWLLTREAPN
ncbi:hypothetical protein F5884DRAFT_746165 [Xylogone sp. PMI_703]|nr:hypothetical protein F5884DRAFT_746165 [Xylogone sp. PMI_703]